MPANHQDTSFNPGSTFTIQGQTYVVQSIEFLQGGPSGAFKEVRLSALHAGEAPSIVAPIIEATNNMAESFRALGKAFGKVEFPPEEEEAPPKPPSRPKRRFDL